MFYFCKLAVNAAIEDSDCDLLTISRVKNNTDLPGALWHIYRPWDADKIRDLMNKVSLLMYNSVV
jgi:hypothetical protein